jgi:hypothetical protein
MFNGFGRECCKEYCSCDNLEVFAQPELFHVLPVSWGSRSSRFQIVLTGCEHLSMLGTAMKPVLGKPLPCPSTRSQSTISSSPLSSSYSDTCYVNSPPVSLTDHARSSLASRSSLERRHKKAHVHSVLSSSPNGSIRGFNVVDDLKESSQPAVARIGTPQGLLKKCFASPPLQNLQVQSRLLISCYILFFMLMIDSWGYCVPAVRCCANFSAVAVALLLTSQTELSFGQMPVHLEILAHVIVTCGYVRFFDVRVCTFPPPSCTQDRSYSRCRAHSVASVSTQH